VTLYLNTVRSRIVRVADVDDAGAPFEREDVEWDVIDSFRDGNTLLRAAGQLWALVDQRSGDRLRAVMTEVATRERPDGELVYHLADLRRLIDALDGLETALQPELVDASFELVDDTRIAELRARLPALASTLDVKRPSHELHGALWEALMGIQALRRFLQRAVAAECDVVLAD